ncbi:hypothetical protein GCM10028772_30350 [Nocardioides ultimimeridianus]
MESDTVRIQAHDWCRAHQIDEVRGRITRSRAVDGPSEPTNAFRCQSPPWTGPVRGAYYFFN